MATLRNIRRLSSFMLALPVAAAALAQGPAQVGQWGRPIPWPIVGIHSAVLPTGEVFNLTYVDIETELETAATVWNPATGRFRNVSPGFGDMFCSGQNFLPTGELFVAGGYAGLSPADCPARGIKPTYIFNPFNLSWRPAGDMAFPRFYPTVISLGDGKQLIIGGQGSSCQYIPIMEMFEPGRGLFRVQGPSQIMQDYPRVFLMSDGSLVQVAPELHTSIMDRSLKSWRNLSATRLLQDRFEAAAFYVPGKQDRLMVCGGYTERVPLGFDTPTATCETIDPISNNPGWRSVASLREARGDINVVLLPDATVLLVGGGAHHRYEGPDLNPELYDPARNTWSRMAPQRYGRMYHATAVLLPDGRVLSAGQDDDGHGDNEISGAWGEVFSPPYLFKGARPGISKAPSAVSYGSTFEIDVSQTGSIANVVLMGLSSVTHSTNVGQRYVPLEFSRKGGATLTVRMTDNPNLAPPGYYMLFAVNNKGVPSKAKMIQAAASCFALSLEHAPPKGGKDPAARPTKSAGCATEGTYTEGAVVDLTALPAEGWELAGWTGTDNDARKRDTNKVTMDSDKTVSVEYSELGPVCRKLSFKVKSKPGGPAPTTEPTMSTECTDEGQYVSGTEITLTAHPKSGWEVGRWRGTDNDYSVLATNVVTMPSANHTVTLDYDRITTSFVDSFEKATLCDWTGRDCKACEVSSCHVRPKTAVSIPDHTFLQKAKIASLLEPSSDASMDGAQSLKLTYESGSKGQDYLIDVSPSRGGGEARYRVSFWIRPREGLEVKGTKGVIARALQVHGEARKVFEVFFKAVKKQKDMFAISVQARTKNGARVKLPAIMIPAGEWHEIVIDWSAASAEGAGDGRIAVHNGENLVAERTFANDSMLVDEVHFGQVKGKKKPTNGSVYFDLFESDWTP